MRKNSGTPQKYCLKILGQRLGHEKILQLPIDHCNIDIDQDPGIGHHLETRVDAGMGFESFTSYKHLKIRQPGCDDRMTVQTG